jgi:L-threonylcarbamoyladenylate synthase
VIVTDPNEATDVIARGSLCAIPTETVYGLGADASQPDAVAQVFEAKGRPSDHPLIVHVASFEEAMLWIAELPKWAIDLAKVCWPGPLTLVGKRTSWATDNITGGQDSVAVRVPSHPLTLQVLSELAERNIHGVVAPSANRFGHVSPTSAQHVAEDLGNYLSAHNGAILDGGPCEVGVESTIVLAIGEYPIVLRPGGITRKTITEITGLPVVEQSAEVPRVSGALASHYSPNASVQLIDAAAVSSLTSGGLIAFTEISTPAGVARLAAPTTIEEFANSLYAALRAGDQQLLDVVYVVMPLDEGLAEAVRDRLSRAAF